MNVSRSEIQGGVFQRIFVLSLKLIDRNLQFGCPKSIKQWADHFRIVPGNRNYLP